MLIIVALFGLAPVQVFADEVESLPTLIPIVFQNYEELPGAGGSVWGGNTYYYNPGPEPRMVPQSSVLCGSICLLEPGIPIELIPKRVAPERGSLYYVKGIYEARAVESSQPSQPGGFEVPVVYPSEFLRQATVLLAVPRSDDFRSTLRVYDPTRNPESAVLVEFLRDSGEVVSSTTLYPGADPVVLRDDDDSRFFPGFDAIHDLETAFPELRDITGIDPDDVRYHVRITPLNDDAV